ncbi:MAG: aminopeptidase [Lachnospiraceae bacterium]|nr:aminopeptidase [Lachnospiraceae bacterium]
MTIIEERYELCHERIKEIAQNAEVSAQFQEYFKQTAKLVERIVNAYKLAEEGFFDSAAIEELRRVNRGLYEELFDKNYETCYANPTYACKMLGTDMGKLLSFLYAELRSMIPYAFEKRLEDMVIRMELFVEVYNMFSYAISEEEQVPSEEELRDTMYWFVSDYSETTAQWRVATQVDTTHDFAVRIIMDSDLDNVRYLYKYGEFITPEIEKLSQYLAGLSDERIQMIADTYTEGYRIGFEKAGKPLEKKETVDIRYALGFERVVRAAVKNFERMGLKPVIYRASDSIFHKNGVNKIGYYGADANKQYRYDHKDDIALFLDKKLVNRKLEVLKLAYENLKDKARLYAGPAVIEVFGEEPFAPKTKAEACALSSEQQKLSAEYKGASAEIVNQYIIGEERSFTIIAFPVPDIGNRFEEIFDETVKLNTLDYTTYERIQATIVEALNTAKYVEIKGMNGNKTDLRVQLYQVKDPGKEAVFENCVADVNIPVGEVFTSPVLEGTNGKLFVSNVFLNELEYRNLEIDFQDGMIADYTCTNFEREEENKKYIKENVLFNYETLPMGEFAIGTNTTAYMTAKKYGISKLFPILIAEKTGPHFAVGDTCYSREEDVKLYNEDGREIVAKDNSVSLLRHTDPSKAYFACHTDITIPYDELGAIIACYEDGTKCTIIENGRFVLEGTQELNQAFDEP